MELNEALMNLAVAVIMAVSALITAYVIPWLRSVRDEHVDERTWRLAQRVYAGVVDNVETDKLKSEAVHRLRKRLSDAGIVLDEDDLVDLIEAAEDAFQK